MSKKNDNIVLNNFSIRYIDIFEMCIDISIFRNVYRYHNHNSHFFKTDIISNRRLWLKHTDSNMQSQSSSPFLYVSRIIIRSIIHYTKNTTSLGLYRVTSVYICLHIMSQCMLAWYMLSLFSSV